MKEGFIRKWCTGAGVALIATLVISPAPAQSLSDVNTTGWISYRNEKMGFEAKFPRDWHVRPVSGTGESVLINGTPEAGKENLSLQFWVQRKINPKGLSIEQWYAFQLQGNKSAPSALSILGGRTAIRREVAGSLGMNFAFFTSLNPTDVFEVTIAQPSSEPLLNPIYAAILSTVRFIN